METLIRWKRRKRTRELGRNKYKKRKKEEEMWFNHVKSWPAGMVSNWAMRRDDFFLLRRYRRRVVDQLGQVDFLREKKKIKGGQRVSGTLHRVLCVEAEE